MKTDRLLALTIYLMNHGKTSASKLAKEYEVSSRTIMRDMDTLDRAGIPICSTPGINGGFGIMENYVLDKQVVSQNDFDYIVTALKGLLSAYTNKDVEQSLNKMELLSNNKQAPVQVDFSVASEDSSINEKIHILEQAINQNKKVQFLYRNGQDEEKQFIVEPVGVEFKWYSWYLTGYYEKHQANCKFKLIRMQDLIITNMIDTGKKEDLNVDLEQKDERKRITVKLYGKSKVKIRCREYLNGKITKEYENGDFEFSFTVPENETYWYGVILSLGSKIKIIEPKQLIERILQTCNSLLEEYGG